MLPTLEFVFGALSVKIIGYMYDAKFVVGI